MNETTQAKMNELLGWLMESVKAGGDFVQAQAPDVAREIVVWGRVEGGAGLIGMLVLMVATVIAWRIYLRWLPRAKAAHKSEMDSLSNDDRRWHTRAFDAKDRLAPLCVGTALAIIACVGLLTINGVTFAKATYTPKLYVLEQVRGMLK